MRMELSQENPSIRYIKVMHLDEVVNLFRMDGSVEMIQEHVERVEAAWQAEDPHVTVHILGVEESKKLEARFLGRGCVLWEEATTKFPGFTYSFNWN